MADEVTVEHESGSTFAPYFGMYHGIVKIEYANLPPSKKRMVAVACALELIKGQKAIDSHISSLSTYADEIQKALEVK